MNGHLAAAISLFFALGSCAARDERPAPAAGAAASVTILLRSAATVTGQPLRSPEPPWEAVISRSELPAGGALPRHRHPWPRFVYIEQGQLRVSYEASGLVRDFGTGEAIIEALDEWHEAVVIGPAPVRLIVFDQLPPGQTNVALR
jgi:quercetin dioxygenase-like cupin family protein